MLFPVLRPSSLPVVVTQPNERHANRPTSVLEWYDRHRAYNILFKRRRSFNEPQFPFKMVLCLTLIIYLDSTTHVYSTWPRGLKHVAVQHIVIKKFFSEKIYCLFHLCLLEIAQTMFGK